MLYTPIVISSVDGTFGFVVALSYLPYPPLSRTLQGPRPDPSLARFEYIESDYCSICVLGLIYPSW
jgi:hypothetical protein